jgi:transcriptional regulator with XRE-family HTH domain
LEQKAEETYVERFGDLLRHFRIRAGMSQSSLAEQANVDKSYISRIENGERKYPSRSVVLQLAEILQLSQAEIDLWLISAGYVSPRMQRLAATGVSRLLEEIGSLTDEFAAPSQS